MTTPAPTPAYPLARPTSSDDPRFTLGLIYDVGKVLAAHGYPPIVTGADHTRLGQALFNAIYQEKETATS